MYNNTTNKKYVDKVFMFCFRKKVMQLWLPKRKIQETINYFQKVKT